MAQSVNVIFQSSKTKNALFNHSEVLVPSVLVLSLSGLEKASSREKMMTSAPRGVMYLALSTTGLTRFS